VSVVAAAVAVVVEQLAPWSLFVRSVWRHLGDNTRFDPLTRGMRIRRSQPNKTPIVAPKLVQSIDRLVRSCLSSGGEAEVAEGPRDDMRVFREDGESLPIAVIFFESAVTRRRGPR
jgi:hypothetical protein